MTRSLLGDDPASLPDGGYWKPLDARLGVPGLPQSATGQATILTGVNAPRRVGRHVSAIPDRRVRELLEEDNLFRMLGRAGRRATFANAYTPAYFARKRAHISATTRSLMAAGIPLRRLEDLRAGRALFHDYSNLWLRERATIGSAARSAASSSLSRRPPGRPSSIPRTPTDSGEPADLRMPPAYPPAPAPLPEDDASTIPERTAQEAADILFGLAWDHHFVLHEHFLTDLAGHRGTDDERLAAAGRIEALVEPLARGAARHEVLVLVVSDHGNLESVTTRAHTLNPVPLLAWGPGAEQAVASASDLTHVVPAVMSALGLREL